MDFFLEGIGPSPCVGDCSNIRRQMKQNNKKVPIIIDTDPGHDDALAIMLLEYSEMVDIKAVTTVAGNGTIQNVTDNARYVLGLLGSDAPLYSGSSKPLKRALVRAVVHGENGLDGAPVERGGKLTGDAVRRIISIIRENPGEISILAIGPETNVAQAFLLDPELPRLVKRMVIMGGSIAAPGNESRVAEFNIFVDPEAAEIVFNAPVEKVLVPLDVCNDIILTKSDFNALKGTPLYEPVSKMMEKYISGISMNEKVKGALVYDPLAAYYFVDPNAYILEPMDVRIETKGEFTRGMTVAERRIWGMKDVNVLVATKVDGGRFKKDFFRILKGKER